MAERYPGGYITKTPPAPTSTAAPGVWTLEQAMQNVKAGTWPPNGPYFIEDVFSTYLYTGDGNDKTITNNINLSGKGGLVWIKGRDSFGSHVLADTVNGVNKYLSSNSTAAITSTTSVSAFSTTGFTVSTNSNVVQNGVNFSSWTFREQPKFFDIVTYTGDGVNGRAISHNLGSSPGCIIVKVTNTADDWVVWHRSADGSLRLNSTAGTGIFTNAITAVSSTTFTVVSNGEINGNGNTYVAYLFAHDAGGFGTSGTDNVISCGSLTTDASGISSVNLGYEPQWLLLKGASGTNPTTQWIMFDTMRGWTNPANNARLFANLSNPETSGDGQVFVTSTGFGSPNGGLGASTTYIYIAIRRGPMKTPTSGTSVFAPVAYTGTGSANNITTPNFPVDFIFTKSRTSTTRNWVDADRLRGSGVQLSSNLTAAEAATSVNVTSFASMTGISVGTGPGVNASSETYAQEYFRRAPGFFDVVCDTGTGSAHAITHNLGVTPEFIIRKMRSGVAGWFCYHSALGNTSAVVLNQTFASAADIGYWNNTSPTSTQFTVGTSGDTNQNTATFVTYLFASVSGVSKVGSYTGNGSSQTINCGFTGGSRFVLIKRTDSTGDWYVWDSARGIVAGNDPYLLLNSTAAEVTTDDSVDTDNSGFVVNQLAATNINVNAATYIFLAIA